MAELAVGSTFAGCRLEQIAGRGGMGVVYKATQIGLDRPVALKAIAPDVALDPAFQERFKHEARLAASIDHPHIVPVYEAGEIDGQLYLVMRWVEGVDLRALIDRGRALEPQRAARLGSQVASALAAAHAKRLMHRDVKPANILIASVDEAEHAYLTDFGIAKLEQAATGLTRTGMMVGTIDYMPPERIEGQPGDARSDIYSLGCVLYEMLTGEPPFRRESEGARIYAHMSAEVPWATDVRPEVPERLSEIAQRAMAKKPEERFQTAGEMSRALAAGATMPMEHAPQPTRAAATMAAETQLRPTPTEAAPPAPPPQPPAAPPPAAPPPAAQPPAATPPARERSRPPVAALAIVAAVVVAAVVGVIVLSSGGGGESSESESSSASSSGNQTSDGGQASDDTVQSNAPAGVPISVPGSPDGLAAGGGTIWVTGPTTGEVSRIDAASGDKIGQPITVGADPDTIAVGDDAVWVTNKDSDSVSRIDPQSAEVVAEIAVGFTPAGIGLDEDGAPWVALTDDDGVKRIDPATNQPGPLIKTGDEPYALLVDDGTVWTSHLADGTVTRFESPDGPVESVNVGGAPRALAVEGSSLWVVDREDRLVEVDRTSGEVLDDYPLAGEPREMVAYDGALWITLHGANELARFDVSSHKLTTRDAPGSVVGITAHANRIWVGAREASTVTPFAP